MTERTTRLLTTFIAGAMVAACGSSNDAPSPGQLAPRQPNILLIVADDLGYSDIGAFGGEIATPNLDTLAANGRILTNFHTAAVCSPTRARLISGADHHLSGIGNMAEVVGMNIMQNRQLNAPWGRSNRFDFDNIPAGYLGHLSPKALSVAELLRDGGYHTMMAGKWHLAYEIAPPDDKVRAFYRVKFDALPHARGFERSFALVNGGGSHYAPSTPPTPLDLTVYAENARIFPAADLPRDYFSTAAFTDKLIGWIDANRDSGKPFFAYAAYTAPHWPLQAPAGDIRAQKGRYDEGYEVVKTRRLERMKRSGLVPEATEAHQGVPSPRQGGLGPRLWAELEPDERAREARLMEIYAAMVSNLDMHVGRLFDHLRRIGEYDNTLIMFFSDNGPEGAEAFAPSVPGTRVDNRLENLGRPGSVTAYGVRWAEVSATPFRLFKGFTGAEGATASPMIVKLPGQRRSLPVSGARMQVTDILPTLLDAAGVSSPGARYRGREIHPIEGLSFWEALRRQGAMASVHSPESVLADELMGSSYVVKGTWKLSQTAGISPDPVLREQTPWQLFDLNTDRAERFDLATRHPDVVSDLLEARAAYARRTGLLEHRRIYSGR